jgi:hypothetical protein
MREKEKQLMPLRDHFRPPLDDLRHWEGFLAGWPVMIVAQLHQKLPRLYFAEPWVQSRVGAEVDVTTVIGRPAQDSYEVHVYEEQRPSRLVAAVEIVSPLDKDRPEHRRALVSKCAGLLRENVSIVVVDIVTTCTQNLYGELLDLIGQSDPALSPKAPSLYAAACRTTNRCNEWLMDTWTESLALGRPLPTMPLWLADNLAVPVELEASYEQSCDILNIP